MAGARKSYATSPPPRLPQRLYEAGRKGDVKELRSLLQSFSMAEARNTLEQYSITTEPLLNIAVRFKHTHLVRFLVDYYDVCVDARDKGKANGVAADEIVDETTPFMQSVLGGNVNILRVLCKKLHDPNRGYPMHRVCGGDTPNGIQVLKILLHSGADVNLRNQKGMTPLMIACQKRATEMVKILLQQGAKVHLSSPSGNTALHYAIKRTDEVIKESIWNRLQIPKLLLKYGAISKENNKGLTPIQLACIKGNADTVNYLANHFSVSYKERADYYELLASSVYFNSIKRDGKFAIMCKVNDCHNVAYDLLAKAMSIRISHDPPLWKFSTQERDEGLVYRVESQTMEELAAIKYHGEGLIGELILARQRILGEAAYDEHLLPFITEYFLYLKNEEHYRQAISLLTLRLRIQLRLPQRKFEHTIIFLLGIVRSFASLKGDTDRHIVEAIMTFIEECYKCDISEKRFLLRWLYLTPLHLLFLCLLDPKINDAGREDVRSLASRFLRATKDIKDSVLSTYAHYDEAYLFGSCTSEPYRAVAGDNALHVACRHIPKKEYLYRSHDGNSVTLSRALAQLLVILHDCGEDVNAKNSEGKTPLKVLLDRHTPSMTAQVRQAVHGLLMVGANPDMKDKLEQTSLHSVITGYVSRNSDVTCDIELKAVLQMLLKSGADPNSSDKRGYSPLHLLIDRSSTENMKYYLFDHRMRGTDNVRCSFHEMFRLLQQYGAFADSATNDGRTVLDMCRDSVLEEELRRNIPLSRANWLKLSRLAARVVRIRKIPYQEATPVVLKQVIELQN